MCDRFWSCLQSEGFFREHFSPLELCPSSKLLCLSRLRVVRAMVDYPGKRGVLQVPPVRGGGQHVDMPDPVDVERRQVVQVRLETITVIGDEGNPTLFISTDILILHLVIYIFNIHLRRECFSVVSSKN